MKPYVFGIDLGGTTAKIGFFSSDGKLIDKWAIPTRNENRGAHVIGDLAEAVSSKMEEYGITSEEVEGIGIGVPGAVRDDGYVEPCVNISGWGGFNLNTEFEKACGIRTVTANDVNCAAMGEYCCGSGRGYSSIVMAALGTGIGAGIIIDGKLMTGAHGAAGELGHVKVDSLEQRTCGCGKKGCLEQFSSATGTVYLAQKMLSGSTAPSSMRSVEGLACKDIFDCASAGDEAALEVVESMADKLGMALAAASCIIDPEVFIIGGGVSAGGETLLAPVRKYFRKYAFPACEKTGIILASLGNDAGIYGGLGLIVNR